ncbi:hypothetical protein [Labrenzia sp. VG12]|uniref:hypothetical protein n=1 Tax=Labrenzia sp. VG12 TaxID=2021862 RepID=UPI000B8C1A93|nr:hypothetical protein [Labrenzia sp. VG12]ASP33120.1 hypothetical protein CHH27_07560 [Labrenzia sp. VG12]
MISTDKTILKRAALLGVAIAVVALLLLQLVTTVFSIKDFWLVAVQSAAVWRHVLLPQLMSPGVWSILISTLECLVILLVLTLVVLRPRKAWKIYLALVVLELISALLSFAALRPDMPDQLQSAVILGYGYALLRMGLTLVLLLLLARLAAATSSTVEVENRA